MSVNRTSQGAPQVRCSSASCASATARTSKPCSVALRPSCRRQELVLHQQDPEPAVLVMSMHPPLPASPNARKGNADALPIVRNLPKMRAISLTLHKCAAFGLTRWTRTAVRTCSAMASRETAFVEITPEVLLKAYACGIFPMAESAETRRSTGSSRRSAASFRSTPSMCRRGSPAPCARTASASRVNRDFEGVLDGCAEPQPGRTPHLDQHAHPQALPQALRHRPLPQRRGL